MAWNLHNFIALAMTLTVLAVVSVVLRFWARKKSKTKFGVEDALIIPAVLCVVGMGITMVIGTQIAQMAQHPTTKLDPHDPIYAIRLKNYAKINYILQVLPLAAMGFSKMSVLCFYRRMFFVYDRFLIVNSILMCIVSAWAIALFFATLFQCKNPGTLWTGDHTRPNCVKALPFYYAVSITGFVTDLLILASPLPIIYRLQMPLKTRVAIAGILLLGAVVCGAGIARFVVFVDIGRAVFRNIADLTYFTTPVFAWTMVETSLAVVSANLPLLRPLLHRKTYTSSYAWSLFRSLRSKHSHNESQEVIGSVSGGSSKQDVQYVHQLKTSQKHILEAGPIQMEPVYLKNKYEP